MDSDDPRIARFIERSRTPGTPEWSFRLAVRQTTAKKPPPTPTPEDELLRAAIMVLAVAEPKFMKEFPSLKGDA